MSTETIEELLKRTTFNEFVLELKHYGCTVTQSLERLCYYLPYVLCTNCIAILYFMISCSFAYDKKFKSISCLLKYKCYLFSKNITVVKSFSLIVNEMSTETIEELLKRTTTNEFVSELKYYGNSFLPIKYEKDYAERVENYEVFDDDVWLHSYPKSGTTWTQEMVWLIANDFDYEGAKTLMVHRFPHIILSSLFNFDKVADSFPHSVGGNSTLKSVLIDSVKYSSELKLKPRCQKTHLPYNLLPKSIRTGEKRPKMIYVMRNPKDVCVSYYHHYVNVHLYTGTFEEFCQLFLADKLMFSPYWQNVLSYWAHKDDPNLLILRYEDMKADLRSVALKVAKYLNKTVNEEQMETLLKHLSFEEMKKNPAVSLKPLNGSDFVRKGIVGDHKNVMSKEINEQFDEWIKKNNNGLIY